MVMFGYYYSWNDYSAVDIKHTTGGSSNPLETNKVAVCECVARSPETSARHTAQKLQILTATLYRILS